jgi:hypothetical protein
LNELLKEERNAREIIKRKDKEVKDNNELLGELLLENQNLNPKINDLEKKIKILQS